MNRPALYITATLLLACLAGWAAAEIPPREIARETVDLMEVNHFYDEGGRLVFDQVIFLQWNDGQACWDVIAWRLIKSNAQRPQRDWANGGYVAIWQDGELMRVVRSKERRETFTQFDPELAAREELPKEYRRELTVRRCK